MYERDNDADTRSMVIVPSLPGPPVRLDSIGELGRSPDEVDALIDEVFGPPDDRGPSSVDAVLLVGGAGAVGASLAWSLPGVVFVVGAAAGLLGAVLPVRLVSRRFGRARRERLMRSLIGDGIALRSDHPVTAELLAACERLAVVGAQLAPIPQSRVDGVAHAALREVATLLDGSVPETTDELAYVNARTHALAELERAVSRSDVGDGEHDRRRAMVEARREVEDIDGASSVTDAADLSRELRGPDVV